MPSDSNNSSLTARLESALHHRKARSVFRQLSIAPPSAIDFSSNDFLSLSSNPELRQQYNAETTRTSHLPLGSGGSRLLDGNSSYAQDLEQSIADFHGAPAALLFNSGFDANSGLFSCLPQREDVIVYDEYIHASVHEGMRLSRAATARPFAHNNVADFARLLAHLLDQHPALRSGHGHVFVAVEAVYSMDGDIAPLEELLSTIGRLLPLGNGHLIVDEAHGTGVYGPHGRGVVSSLGLESKVFARLHTFGKALAANGAALLCSKVLRSFLINYARSLIYTTAPGLPALNAIAAAYSMLRSGATLPLQNTLWDRVAYFHAEMSAARPRLATHVVLEPEPPKSPIFALITKDPRSLAAWCQSKGCIVRAIMPPTVPEGSQRVRVCLHAGNTVKEIDHLVHLVVAWCASRQQSSFDVDAKSRL